MNKDKKIIAGGAAGLVVIGTIIGVAVHNKTPENPPAESSKSKIEVSVGDGGSQNSNEFLGSGGKVDIEDRHIKKGERLQETADSILGHWAAGDSAIFDFIPDVPEGQDEVTADTPIVANIIINSQTYTGRVETDDKTYIKVSDKDTGAELLNIKINDMYFSGHFGSLMMELEIDGKQFSVRPYGSSDSFSPSNGNDVQVSQLDSGEYEKFISYDSSEADTQNSDESHELDQ